MLYLIRFTPGAQQNPYSRTFSFAGFFQIPSRKCRLNARVLTLSTMPPLRRGYEATRLREGNKNTKKKKGEFKNMK